MVFESVWGECGGEGEGAEKVEVGSGGLVGRERGEVEGEDRREWGGWEEEE